jgi:ubiquinone/menaquinone biosynthesis C-methylase UbiE
MKRALLAATIVMLSTSLLVGQGQRPRPQQHGRLFPPQDLGLLEAPDRDAWQHPDQVMDKLGIAEASVVADVGAGAGWFTIRLARRVGPNGTIFAEDVQPEMLAAISRRVNALGLTNVKPILGKGSDPRLPAGSLDAVLMVDAYHELDDREARLSLLRNLAKALRPNGRIGLIDFRLEGTGPGPANEERVSPETVVSDAKAAGLELLSHETFLPYQYFLIFKRPAATRTTSTPQAERRLPRRP